MPDKDWKSSPIVIAPRVFLQVKASCAGVALYFGDTTWSNELHITPAQAALLAKDFADAAKASIDALQHHQATTPPPD